MRRLLERIGLDRPETRAWAMYDWANSAFQCTIITAVFPVYYGSVAAAGLPGPTATARFATATTVALTIIALASPILGAYADFAGAKKRMLASFMAIGVTATAAMFFIDQGEWRLALALFVMANIGISGSFVFYDSLLPHIASDKEMDRVSSAGYALGYLGGGLLLVLNLLWIMQPALFGLRDAGVASRLSFLSVAVWWVAFSIPLFRRVREPAVTPDAAALAAENLVRASFVQLADTLREFRRYRQASLMLLAFLIYNDGIGTIIRMAGIYGTELNLPQSALIGAIVMVQFVGIPFAVLFGKLAGRIGAKRAIFLSLVVYTCISIIGYTMTAAWQFYLLAFLVGTVQGGSQALSRSLFATMIPRHKSSEFFGFFAVFEKFAGIFGPAVFAVTVSVTGSSRNAI
ncbi:MAG TPA: MFS transporter, partial [Vicinamibacterales bacterium]|nr:MFS transporter [Vicinamibacterales bacterium]